LENKLKKIYLFPKLLFHPNIRLNN